MLHGLNIFCQNYFDEPKLLNPKKNGPAIKAKFKEEFVYEYKISAGKHAVFLRNGLRSSDFISPQLWLNIRDTVYPYQVDIVYSRYPVRDSVYHEIYPLLCNRLIHLFELDASLNDADFTWRTILQTHIDNDEQVNKLFHGVVIWYRTPAEEAMFNRQLDSIPENKSLVQTEKNTQGGIKELESTIANIKQENLLNDSLQRAIENKPLDVQKNIIKKHLERQVLIPSTIKLADRTPFEMQQYKRQINEFLKINPFYDSVVWKVMERHPEWVDALVVNDWTGSMYGYGAQVVHWHINNYRLSGIRFLTLFNDGDNKTNASKVIGETGGIYSAEASDIPTILNLFNLVRINGSGGDRQENDVEAILESMKRFPNHKEVILIADNLACIRDIELAVKINKPVRVIVCGYIKEVGVNPHLAYLAKITNGGLYTLTQDIENLKLEAIGVGDIKDFKDRRFGITSLPCKAKPIYELNFAKESFKTYTNYDSALAIKDMVRRLDLTEQSLTKYPAGISKMKQLIALNLSKNNLTQLPNNIKKLENLKELNLSKNQLSLLPKRFIDLKYLESLNLSYNEISTISSYFISGYYLKKIDVSNNQLNTMEGLNLMKNLQYANFSANNITELPPEVHQLKRLISLDLSNNKLLYLPRTFAGLTKLEELNLENNNIGSLPPYLYRLRKLKYLNLAGNPLGEKEKDRIRKELPNVEITF
jgi:Leucine-rich repeat (LRR) protein